MLFIDNIFLYNYARLLRNMENIYFLFLLYLGLLLSATLTPRRDLHLRAGEIVTRNVT